MKIQRAIAYLRASTEDQVNSIDVQREAVTTYANKEGFGLVDIVTDLGMSGAVHPMQREALASVINRIRNKEADILVVYKFDRIARKAWYVLELVDELDELGVPVLSVSDPVDVRTGEGMLMLGILAAMAQYERFLIRRRTKATLAMKRNRGERTGTVPYGYTVGEDKKTLVPLEEEQAIIRVVLACHKDSVSNAGIAERLNEIGRVNRADGPFNKEQIRRILKRAKDEGKL